MSYLEELDIPSAKERFMSNESLYKKFLYKLPDNTLLEDLEKHLADDNVEEAFKDAHTMKGVVGNLSMYKVMNAVDIVTEKLRAKEMPSEDELNALRSAYTSAINAINDIKENDITLF